MNKAQLVAALADRLGDRGAAALAVDELLDVIVRAVHAGDSVTIPGFGVFERRERAARTGRNPQTGEAIQLAATSVPGFRAGAAFRDVVSGVRVLPAVVAVEVSAASAPASRTRTAAAPVPAATRATTPAATQSAPLGEDADRRQNGDAKGSDASEKAGKGGKKSNDKPKPEKRDKGGKKKRSKK